MSDLAMATLGADLKRREMLSGRMADALAWMYMGSATLKRFLDDGSRSEDLPFARWAMQTSVHRAAVAMDEVLENFPVAWVRWMRPIVFPFGAYTRPPRDRLTAQVGRSILEGRSGRETLTRDIFIPSPGTPGLGTLEDALAKTVAARPVEEKLRSAVRERRLTRGSLQEQIPAALSLGIIARDEAHLLESALTARTEAIQVDAFPPGYLGLRKKRAPRTGEIVPQK